MDLKKLSNQIRKALEKRRKELKLSFVEEQHIYYMKDNEGKVRADFPSVSKVYKKFYQPFDAEGKSLKLCNGDINEATLLREKWKKAGDLSTNLGSRVHFELESDLVGRNENYKEVRRPLFEITEEQKTKSDNMIVAGKKFLDLMYERGATLLDTEIVLGDPSEGYVGQPDKVWLMLNKDKTDFGFVITDWKTNQPKNFEIQPYTGRMFPPFEKYYDTALTHYYLQLPLYGRLLIKMLEGTKFENTKLLGSVVVLLRDNGNFEEHRVPQEVSNNILSLDLSKYLL